MSSFQNSVLPSFAPQSAPLPGVKPPSASVAAGGYTSYEAAESGFDSDTNVDELTRIFNSAIVSTRAEESRDFSAELYQLVQTPAFSAILSAVRLLSRSQGLTEAAAAEQVIATFRRLDAVWTDYLFQEGVDRVRGQSKEPQSP